MGGSFSDKYEYGAFLMKYPISQFELAFVIHSKYSDGHVVDDIHIIELFPHSIQLFPCFKFRCI